MALLRPKKFFGAAQHRGRRLADHHRHRPRRHRQPDGRGHLRGVQGHQANMEIHLDRRLIDKRTFPAIDINRSGTRKGRAAAVRGRSSTGDHPAPTPRPAEPGRGHGVLLDKMSHMKTNSDFIASMNSRPAKRPRQPRPTKGPWRSEGDRARAYADRRGAGGGSSNCAVGGRGHDAPRSDNPRAPVGQHCAGWGLAGHLRLNPAEASRSCVRA